MLTKHQLTVLAGGRDYNYWEKRIPWCSSHNGSQRNDGIASLLWAKAYATLGPEMESKVADALWRFTILGGKGIVRTVRDNIPGWYDNILDIWVPDYEKCPITGKYLYELH